MKINSKLILSIETTMTGGSLSLLNGEIELINWFGSGNTSNATELLQEINNLFDQTGKKKKDLGLIFVSEGFGSFTGARVGWSIAKGLSKALKCDCYGVSLLEAVNYCEGIGNKNVIFIQNSKREVVFQKFETSIFGDTVSNPKTEFLSLKDFDVSFLGSKQFDGFNIIFQKELYENFCKINKNVSLKDEVNKRVTILDNNLAKYVGKYGRTKSASDNDRQVYLNTSFNK